MAIPSVPEVDCSRIIAHFDVDCFYAQAEILRRPHLRDRPVGITQKFLVVTSNYVARQFGVPKMVPIEEAKKRCPDLVLINGEDLTPYRAASKEIMNVLRRFGTVERLGLDECGLDITSETKRRAASGTFPKSFLGLVIGMNLACEVVRDGMEETAIKPTACDLRNSIPCPVSKIESKEIKASACVITSGVENESKNFDVENRNLLMIGSYLAAEIRAAVEKETGFQCSCGISYNKMLAKMACSVNKPNKQTCLLKSAIANFLHPLPVRKLPGVGRRIESMLKDTGIQTIAELENCNLQQLTQMFGERTAHFLFNASRGVDLAPVRDKGPPKSLSVEDSFPPCTSLKCIEAILSSLSLDLLARLDEDKLETGRRPQAFSIKWRQKGSSNFTSTSTQMPSELLSTKCSMERRKKILVQTGMSLVSRSLRGRAFSVIVLNIGATNFTDSCPNSLGASQDIRSLLQNSSKLQEPDTIVSEEKVMFSGQDAETNNSVIGHVCPSLVDWKQDDHSGQLFSAAPMQDNFPVAMPPTDEQQFAGNKVQKSRPNITTWQPGDDDIYRLPFVATLSCTENHDLQTPSSNPSISRVSVLCPTKEDLAEKCNTAEIFPVTHELGKQYVPTQSPLISEIGYQDRTIHYSGESVRIDKYRENLFEIVGHTSIGSTCSHFTDSEHRIASILHNSPHNKRDLDMGHNHMIETFICEKCGQKLHCDKQSRQEHEDYHYALDLQSKETNQPTISLNDNRNTSNHLARPPYSKKHKKNQNVTLDSFFSRLK